MHWICKEILMANCILLGGNTEDSATGSIVARQRTYADGVLI